MAQIFPNRIAYIINTQNKSAYATQEQIFQLVIDIQDYFSDPTFTGNLDIDGNLNVDGDGVVDGSLTAGSFFTSTAATNLEITDNTIVAGGTDANVDILIETKGTGSVVFNTDGDDKWSINGSGSFNPAADATYDIGNLAVNPRDIHASRSVIVKGVADVGYGQIAIKQALSTQTFTGGATENIAVQVPSGAKILGVNLRVDTAITFGGGGATWAAAYNTGSTQSIATAKSPAQNTKVNTMYDANADSDVTTAITDITITPDVGTLETGEVTAIVYYMELTSLTNV